MVKWKEHAWSYNQCLTNTYRTYEIVMEFFSENQNHYKLDENSPIHVREMHLHPASMDFHLQSIWERI